MTLANIGYMAYLNWYIRYSLLNKLKWTMGVVWSRNGLNVCDNVSVQSTKSADTNSFSLLRFPIPTATPVCDTNAPSQVIPTHCILESQLINSVKSQMSFRHVNCSKSPLRLKETLEF